MKALSVRQPLKTGEYFLARLKAAVDILETFDPKGEEGFPMVFCALVDISAAAEAVGAIVARNATHAFPGLNPAHFDRQAFHVLYDAELIKRGSWT